ncbi:TetR/AcrR family transcriptional regulator [Rhodococcus qingshengii]|uniref:TetR/AcrR family transcriptional regulator n=1 Tax=Rhodococcus qingshengii TaxID=334542 RepID=UPI000815A648|nr:TetR/AcrR family transcriptional regulator [Rhodococcus qingshengii]SCC62996.1 transcriptional regulator, TetR family [Rhodococcus qingshengii]
MPILEAPSPEGKTEAMAPPYQPTLRQAQKSLTRNRLLDAAVEVLSTSPTLDTTVDEIAKAAGVTRATLYAHFPNKAEIIRGLAERLYALGDEVYSELGSLPRWTPETIRSWLETVESKWREQAADIRVLSASGTAMLGDSTANPHERYVVMLTAQSDRWEGVPAPEARQRCLMFILAIEGFFSAWIAAGWTMETKDPLALLCDSICHSLAPAIEAQSPVPQVVKRRSTREK